MEGFTNITNNRFLVLWDSSTGNSTLIYLQISVVAILLIFLYFWMRYRRSVRLEKRISVFSISSEKDNTWISLDSISHTYSLLTKRLASYLRRSYVLKKYSNQYHKYSIVPGTNHKSGMEFIANKLIIALMLLLVAAFTRTIQSQILNPLEIILPLLVGFFLPDIYYKIKYHFYRRKLENDLLEAIIVMNNAFKSGQSIPQAIELVSKEVEGTMAEEFKKMYLELSLGLDLDVVFSRFADRIKLEEVTYLTASLSILNKTGGNIINVFSSIEKSLFNKKKLKLELESLTGSSRMIIYVLFMVPIIFVVVVSIINPGYFAPFFTTTLGQILLGFMVVYYILYIICVRMIMKVRM